MIIFAVMKKVLVVILVAAVLVALATGCGGAHRYDARLMAADSLMWDAPDSVLAVLGAIDSLGGEANRAYRDLLMTQARYKCYQEITALDDSAISRAITHYRDHSGDREKLTRAYLYKGAVMEELGHVDSAMYYYKTAEATADPDDYTNLGQINTRIGNLYRIHNGNAQTCFEKYQLAFHNYFLARNKNMQLNSLYAMFMMNGITQSALNNNDTIFTKAINLAKELGNDKKLFNLYELRCRQLTLSDSTCHEAKKIALNCLKDFESNINNDLLLDLAYLYAKESKLDSAKHFLNSVDETLSPGDEMHVIIRKNDVLSMIAEREGNVSASRHFIAVNSSLTDSIMDDTDKYSLDIIENEFNLHKHNNNLYEITHLQHIVLGLTFIAILVVALLTVVYLRRLRRTKAIIQELKNVKTDDYDHLLNQLDSKNVIIEQFITNLVTLIKTVSGSEAHNSTSQLAQQIKETVVEIASDDFWCELQSYLDKKHNGLVSNLGQTHKLSKRDLQFIVLSCCGFPNAVVSIIMDYNPKYVFNKRKNLAKKMGLDMPLQDYLESLMAK